MADRPEYKSKWTGEQVDEGIDKALLAISQNDIKQTMGTSPSSVMSQAAVTYAINTIGKTGIEKLNIEPTDNLTVDYSNNIATFNGLKAILKNDEEQTSVPANLKLPISQGTGIEIKVSDSGNSLNFSSSMSLDDYYTKTDLVGRIIPKDASRYGQSLFQSNNGYLKMFSAVGSDQYMIYGGDDINYYYGGSNLVTINRSGCKFSNYDAAVKVGTDTTGGHLKGTSLQFLSGGSSYGQILANPSKTGLKYIGKGSSAISTTSYEFNDVMTQLSGDAFVSSLTEASALNIGKAYLCTQDSTDDAKSFLKGHVYLVGGESGAYTTTDITALGLTEQDLQGRILPADSTSSFATTYWKINSPQTPKNSKDIAITPRANTSEFQLCTYDTLKAAYGRFGCAWGGGVNSHDGSFPSNIEFKFDETNNTLTYNHPKAGISYDMDNVELKQTYEKKILNTYIKDEGISPFTYKAEITLDTLISENSIIELINDDAINFATYGFNIGSISGQNLTIYMVGEPVTNITLTFGIRG